MNRTACNPTTANAKETAGIYVASIAALYLGLLPVDDDISQNNFNYSVHKSDSSQAIKFKPKYNLVGEKLIDVSNEISNEIETMNSLINLGNVIFKNSSNLTAEESAALKLYRKNKYKRF